MSALTAPALVAAGLLVLAGAQKVLDPAMTVGALRALGLPSAPALVRVGAATEMVLGASALSTGDPALWVLVAVSYLAFALVVVAAIRKGTMIGSCGCFGREDTPPHSFDLLDGLFEEIVVHTDAGHPEVHWEHDWPEPWARGDLPDAVVALLALALLEYAGALRETSRPRSRDEERGMAIRDKARRLAQVLVFRDLDRSTAARLDASWTTSVDAFIRRLGDEQWAEGEWFMPSYSLGVRAILETGAVSPFHSVVREAFRTIQGLRYEKPLRSGGTVSTWFDPTRPVSVRTRARQASKETWHARVDITPVLPGGSNRLTRPPVTPAGLHAAAMAWGALRRAAAQADPQDLLDPTERTGRAASFFRTIDIDRARDRFRLTLRSTNGYEESATVSPEWYFVLRALADGPAAEADVRQQINALADEAGHARRVRKPSGLENAVNGINRKFGVDVILSESLEGVPAYTLDATVRLRLR